jgi:hypothetical protein
MIEQYKTMDAKISITGIPGPSAHPRKPKDILAQSGLVELMMSWGEETGDVESIMGPLFIPDNSPLISIKIPQTMDKTGATRDLFSLSSNF